MGQGRRQDETLKTQSSSAWLLPNPEDPRLTRDVEGIDQNGEPVRAAIVHERALTLYLNRQEIVTLMTIGDHPDYLALGYLLNQNMLQPDDSVTGIDHDEDLGVIIVRTARETNFETKLQKRVRTSGCAHGTIFGDVMETFSQIELAAEARLRTAWLYALMRALNTLPSLYLKAGAIHGCALCAEDRVLIYFEDVGRHNAVDKIAGYMWRHGIPADDKIFYTTGRLTSEMIIKTVQMRIPILISRSGFTAWGVDLARDANLTLIGRARGKRFLALAGLERIIFDANLDQVTDEPARFRRKAAGRDQEL
ncbi:MAG: formate dehydrogenase accessory sulfurtransferase FdhD [Pseudomonadota bacterium]